MKRLFISILAIATILFPTLPKAQTLKQQEAGFEVFKKLLDYKGYEAFSFDISALKDQKYKITFDIKEYSTATGKPVEQPSPIPFHPSMNNMMRISQFNAETQKEVRKSGKAYDMKNDIYSLSKRIDIGFIPDEKSDSTVTALLSVDGQGTSYLQLKLRKIKNESTGKDVCGYATRPFVINDFKLGEFIPLVLYGSFWYDPEFKVVRFCGDNTISPDFKENIVEHIPNFYVIGITVTPFEESKKKK